MFLFILFLYFKAYSFVNIEASKFDCDSFKQHAILLYDLDSSQAVLFDCCFSINEATAINDYIAGAGLNLTYVFISHAHYDHYAGCSRIFNADNTRKFVAESSVAVRINSIAPSTITELILQNYPLDPWNVTVTTMDSTALNTLGANVITTKFYTDNEANATSLFTINFDGGYKIVIGSDFLWAEIYPLLVEMVKNNYGQSFSNELDNLILIMLQEGAYVLYGGHGTNPGSLSDLVSLKIYIRNLYEAYIETNSTPDSVYENITALYSVSRQGNNIYYNFLNETIQALFFGCGETKCPWTMTTSTSSSNVILITFSLIYLLIILL